MPICPICGNTIQLDEHTVTSGGEDCHSGCYSNAMEDFHGTLSISGTIAQCDWDQAEMDDLIITGMHYGDL